MFENFPPSKNQLNPDFPISPLTNFAEMNQEEILRIVGTVNETKCANDPFNIRKISSKIISDLIITIYTDILNSLFPNGVFPDSEKYAAVRALLNAGNDTDELSSYRPLYNTPFLSKVLETACLKQLN